VRAAAAAAAAVGRGMRGGTGETEEERVDGGGRLCAYNHWLCKYTDLLRIERELGGPWEEDTYGPDKGPGADE
jgi:hypothetical protein